MSFKSLTDFKTYVKQTFKRTDKDTEIVAAYNEMLKWLSIKMPIGDYKFQSYVTTSVGIEDYELPCDLLHLIHPIRLLDGDQTVSSGYPLDHLTKNEFDRLEPNPNRNNPHTSKPTGYTIWSRSILLTPLPDLASYILEINWGKRPAALAVAADMPSLGEEYEEIIKWGVLERLYESLGQMDMATYWGSKFHDQFGNPIGTLRDLFQIEVSREGEAIGRIKNNSL